MKKEQVSFQSTNELRLLCDHCFVDLFLSTNDDQDEHISPNSVCVRLLCLGRT